MPLADSNEVEPNLPPEMLENVHFVDHVNQVINFFNKICKFHQISGRRQVVFRNLSELLRVQITKNYLTSLLKYYSTMKVYIGLKKTQLNGHHSFSVFPSVIFLRKTAKLKTK